MASTDRRSAVGQRQAGAHLKVGLKAGGARGLAHVGVLKVLEELRVPIDMIAGTSIGAIVGGLNAADMSATELERELLAVCWNEVFASRIERPQLSVRRKEEDFEISPLVELGFRDGELRTPQGAVFSCGLESQLRRDSAIGVGRYSLGGFHQLSGYQTGQLVGNDALLLRATWYRRVTQTPVLTRGFFVGATLEAGNVWAQRSAIRIGHLRTGASLFIGADTGIGPLFLGLTYAPQGSAGLALFIGRP